MIKFHSSFSLRTFRCCDLTTKARKVWIRLCNVSMVNLRYSRQKKQKSQGNTGIQITASFSKRDRRILTYDTRRIRLYGKKFRGKGISRKGIYRIYIATVFLYSNNGPMLFYTTPTAGNLTLGSSGALLNASEHMQTFAKNLEKKIHICLFIS